MQGVRRTWKLVMAFALASTGAGCSAFNTEGLNSRRLPAELRPVPRANKVPINYLMLRQDPPKEYVLDKHDTLGVYIEGILGEPNQPCLLYTSPSPRDS